MNDNEKISEDLADALIESMKAINESLPKMIESMKAANEAVWKEVARQASMKYLGYIEHYVSATFITRWYWKRKADKMIKALHEISDNFNNEFKTIEDERSTSEDAVD